MKCFELEALTSKLDVLERKLSEAQGTIKQAVQEDIATVIKAIQAHRKFHSTCDFNEPIQ